MSPALSGRAARLHNPEGRLHGAQRVRGILRTGGRVQLRARAQRARRLPQALVEAAVVPCARARAMNSAVSAPICELSFGCETC